MNVRELRTAGVRSYQLNGIGTGKEYRSVVSSFSLLTRRCSFD